MALARHGMLVPGAGIEDIIWHKEATRAFGVNWAVVPFKCHAGKVCVVNFLRDFVVLFGSLAKMIQVGIANVLDGKVVNNECKHDEAPCVAPEHGGGSCLVVVEFGKAVLEEFVGKDACLEETIHAMVHLKVNPAVAGRLVELVHVDEFLGDVRKLDVDVFWPVKQGVNSLTPMVAYIQPFFNKVCSSLITFPIFVC